MRFLREGPWYAEANRTRFLVLAAALIAVIAVVDWITVPDFGLGFLYFLPLVLASAFLSRWQVGILAYLCAVLRDAFLYAPPGPERIPRAIFVFLAYAFVAFFTREMVVYRRAAARHFDELEREVALRHQVEEQLEILINSSPAGIVTVSRDGKIVLSNEAAHRIFGVEPGALTGQPIASFLPLLAQLPGMQASFAYRTTIECRGIRATGEPFLAHIWLSTFRGAAGPMTAAIVVDASEESPERQEAESVLTADPPPADGTRQSFTPSEKQVLRMVLQGRQDREIAAELGITESGAKGLVEQLFNKAGVRTRSQLVRVALQDHQDLI